MDILFEILKLTGEDYSEFAYIPGEPHFHDYEELIVGTEGGIEHFIDFNITKLKAPYISFIAKGKLHKGKPFFIEGKCSFWILSFKTEFIPDMAFRLYSYYHNDANIELKDDSYFDRMKMLCKIMDEEMQQKEPNLAIVHDLLKALFTMIEAEKEKYSKVDQSFPNRYNIIFKNFLNILEENFRRNESIDFYAKKLFMSSRNLNLVCQNILHKSASEIIETRKLVEARNMLIYSHKTISEIGYDLGYKEKAYFTSVFKKKVGEKPTVFRNQMKKIVS